MNKDNKETRTEIRSRQLTLAQLIKFLRRSRKISREMKCIKHYIQQSIKNGLTITKTRTIMSDIVELVPTKLIVILKPYHLCLIEPTSRTAMAFSHDKHVIAVGKEKPLILFNNRPSQYLLHIRILTINMQKTTVVKESERLDMFDNYSKPINSIYIYLAEGSKLTSTATTLPLTLIRETCLMAEVAVNLDDELLTHYTYPILKYVDSLPDHSKTQAFLMVLAFIRNNKDNLTQLFSLKLEDINHNYSIDSDTYRLMKNLHIIYQMEQIISSRFKVAKPMTLAQLFTEIFINTSCNFNHSTAVRPSPLLTERLSLLNPTLSLTQEHLTTNNMSLPLQTPSLRSSNSDQEYLLTNVARSTVLFNPLLTLFVV